MKKEANDMKKFLCAAYSNNTTIQFALAVQSQQLVNSTGTVQEWNQQ